MASDMQRLQKGLKPFWGRVMVLPSPVDEAQLPSGLIVPINGKGDAERGVVVAADEAYDEAYPGYDISKILPVGTIVYYEHGVQIGEYIFIEGRDIYAFEEAL
jgi:co-chaperonin GroES (HSP10)